VGEPSTDTLLLPRIATLKGFLDSSANGLDLQTAPPMLELRVETRNTTYRIIVSGQGRIYIEGGRYFPTATPAHFDGASAGGSLLKIGWVVVGLCMEVTANGQRIVTSPVRTILSTCDADERPH
jgi:hypothetical protein